MIVGFKGTFNGPTTRQHESMMGFLRRMPITRFVHAGGIHTDTHAHTLVRTFHKMAAIEIWPGDNDHHSSILHEPPGSLEIYPELPSLIRDQVIVHRVHGLVLVPAFDKAYSAIVEYAREIRLPIYIIRQDGSIVRER